MTEPPVSSDAPDAPKPRSVPRPLAGVTLDELLSLLLKQKASDLHIAVGLPPVLRVYGKLLQAPYEPFTPETARQIAHTILTDEQKRALEASRELGFTYFWRFTHIFRVSVFYERGAIAVAVRLLSRPIPTFAQLETPPVVERFAELTHGLVLVTGSVGCGKDEIIAALIDTINRTRSAHIVTLEHQIEYYHVAKMSVIRQREIGVDTLGVTSALDALQRQDPDIVVMDWLYDKENMRTALSLANDGRLVISSLGTVTAPSTIERFIQSFAEEEQDKIRLDLSNNLQTVICAQRVPKADGTGRVIAAEILVATPQIRNYIRYHQTQQIEAILHTPNKIGMQTMTQSLVALCLAGTITRDTALARSPNRVEMEELLDRANA